MLARVGKEMSYVLKMHINEDKNGNRLLNSILTSNFTTEHDSQNDSQIQTSVDFTYVELQHHTPVDSLIQLSA